MTTTELKCFTGIRVVVATATPFDKVLDNLRDLVGHAPIGPIQALQALPSD